MDTRSIYSFTLESIAKALIEAQYTQSLCRGKIMLEIYVAKR